VSARWGLRRWLRESRAYTRPMPWWKFWPLALAKWPGFAAQQRRDERELQR
jgi:hypothetical protein